MSFCFRRLRLLFLLVPALSAPAADSPPVTWSGVTTELCRQWYSDLVRSRTLLGQTRTRFPDEALKHSGAFGDFLRTQREKIALMVHPGDRRAAWMRVANDYIAEMVPKDPREGFKLKASKMTRILAAATDLNGKDKASLWDTFVGGISAVSLPDGRTFSSEAYRTFDGDEVRVGHIGELLVIKPNGDIYRGVDTRWNAQVIRRMKDEGAYIPGPDPKRLKLQTIKNHDQDD